MADGFNIKKELLAYLEFKISEGISSNEEDELYIDLQWKNSLKLHRDTIKELIEEMRDVFDNGYK